MCIFCKIKKNHGTTIAQKYIFFFYERRVCLWEFVVGFLRVYVVCDREKEEKTIRREEKKTIVLLFSIWSYSAEFSQDFFNWTRTFKSFESSRQQRPDCFVGSQQLHVLCSQMSNRVCHYIDELHKIVHRICTRNLKKNGFIYYSENIFRLVAYLSIQPSCDM